MEADGAFIELAGIHDPMDGIGGIDRTRMRNVHVHGIERLEFTLAGSDILLHKMEVFHSQAADGHGHPAVLVPMIVNRTGLAGFPADGHEFVKRGAVNQIASVVLTIPCEIRRERVGSDRSVPEELAQGFSGLER